MTARQFCSLLTASLTFVIATPAQPAGRAFVASTGSDANLCTPTGPCRSFAAALAVVDSGGEIVALDAAGYGAVTITKPVTITANPGFYAGIAAASGIAVDIPNVNLNQPVTLRRLNINGIGAVTGISITGSFFHNVKIEDCIISNFSQGILVDGLYNTAVVTNTVVQGNSGFGILASGGAWVDVSHTHMAFNQGAGVGASAETDGTTTLVSVTDSVSTRNSAGFQVYALTGTNGNARMTVTRSTASFNTKGAWTQRNGTAANIIELVLANSLVTNNEDGLVNNDPTPGTLESLGNNVVRKNQGSDATGTITTVSPM